MTLDWDFVDSHNYILFNSPRIFENPGQNLQALDIGSILLAVQIINFKYNKVILKNILHFLKVFGNLISASSLHANSF